MPDDNTRVELHSSMHNASLSNQYRTKTHEAQETSPSTHTPIHTDRRAKWSRRIGHLSCRVPVCEAVHIMLTDIHRDWWVE